MRCVFRSILENISPNLLNTCIVSFHTTKGIVGLEYFKAAIKSSAAACIASFEVMVGRRTFSGNNWIMSVWRDASVLLTNTVYNL